jgi:hypothetical protein
MEILLRLGRAEQLEREASACGNHAEKAGCEHAAHSGQIDARFQAVGREGVAHRMNAADLLDSRPALRASVDLLRRRRVHVARCLGALRNDPVLGVAIHKVVLAHFAHQALGQRVGA